MQFARLRDLRDAEHTPIARPEVFFVFAPDEALEVQTPDHVLGLREIQRGEGNPNCGCPASAYDPGLRGPNTVPSGVIVLPFGAALFSDEAVALGAQRIDLKNVGVAAIVRGVDQNLEIVIQVLRQVAPQLGSDDGLRGGIATEDSEIHFVPRVKNPYLSGLSWRLALMRLTLEEIPYRFGGLPQWVVERSIQAGGALDSGCLSSLRPGPDDTAALASTSVDW